MYNKIRKIEEAKKGNVFKTNCPCNVQVKEEDVKEVSILVNKKVVKENIGAPVHCAVCNNHLGYKTGNDYYLMNLIE